MKDNKTDLWSGIGMALVILALCFGIGGCKRLTENKGPLISPTISIHLHSN